VERLSLATSSAWVLFLGLPSSSPSVTLRGGAVLVGQGPGATTECISDASVQVATYFNISSRCPVCRPASTAARGRHTARKKKCGAPGFHPRCFCFGHMRNYDYAIYEGCHTFGMHNMQPQSNTEFPAIMTSCHANQISLYFGIVRCRSRVINKAS
jgi:hypothetical protein